MDKGAGDALRSDVDDGTGDVHSGGNDEGLGSMRLGVGVFFCASAICRQKVLFRQLERPVVSRADL